jgi:hypothetical protein
LDADCPTHKNRIFYHRTHFSQRHIFEVPKDIILGRLDLLFGIFLWSPTVAQGGVLDSMVPATALSLDQVGRDD